MEPLKEANYKTYSKGPGSAICVNCGHYRYNHTSMAGTKWHMCDGHLNGRSCKCDDFDLVNFRTILEDARKLEVKENEKTN